MIKPLCNIVNWVCLNLLKQYFFCVRWQIGHLRWIHTIAGQTLGGRNRLKTNNLKERGHLGYYFMAGNSRLTKQKRK